MTGVLARLRDDERGSGYIAAFLVLFAVLTLGGVGVLADSARIAAAERHASSAAFEAARAGAQAIDVGARRDGIIAIDPIAARAAAHDAASKLLADSNATITAVTVDGDEVVVTVTSHVDSWFHVISGRTVTETGRARLVAGITEEGQ
jgi:hypothetical protein